MISSLTGNVQRAVMTPVDHPWRASGINLHERPNHDTADVNTALARYLEKNSPLRAKYPESIEQEGNGSPVKHPSFFSSAQQTLANIASAEFWATIFGKAGRDGTVNVGDIVEAVNSGLSEGRVSLNRAIDEIAAVQTKPRGGDEAAMANKIMHAISTEVQRNSSESSGLFDLG